VEALARLFLTLPNLQLVFLNGCETFGQTNKIQQLKTPGGEQMKAALISTVKLLNDEIAVSFARFFYYAFYRFNTLNDSFESAQTRLIAKYGVERNFFLKLDRGLDIDDEAEINRNIEKEKTVYTLTALEKGSLNRVLISDVDYEEPNPPEFNYRPNRKLIESITSGILDDSSDAFRESLEYESLLEKFDKYKGAAEVDRNRFFSRLVSDVLELLPFPLGFHFNLLYPAFQPME
jgi:hypothetical protein